MFCHHQATLSCLLSEVPSDLAWHLKTDRVATFAIICICYWGLTEIHQYSLRHFFTPSGVRSASDQTQFASDLASDIGSNAPFHSKQIHRTRVFRILWSQSMVPNPCFRKRQTFIAHNFKRKSVPRHAVSRVNIVAKSNKFSFPTILVCEHC